MPQSSLTLPPPSDHCAAFAALFRARQQQRQQQQQRGFQQQPKPRRFTVAGLARLTMSLRKFRMVTEGSATSRDAVDGEARAKRREQQQQLDGVSVLERIHQEYADRRPLMKPILGRLKQFQESEDVALDIRPRLVEASDLTEKSESKERLIYKKDLEKLGQRGAFVGDILPILQCRMLQGHLDAVQCLQFDERRLVTGSRDMSVRIWDVRSGRSIRKLYGHKGGVTCLHMRDNVLATGSWDMSVMLWSLEPDFRRLRMLTDHEDSVCFVYILPGSKNLVTAAYDATARVYEPPTYRQSALARFPSPVTQAAVAGEQQLATIHADRQLRLTDLSSGRLIRQFGAHQDAVTCLHASGDLLVTGTRRGRLHFWDARAGQCEAAVQADPGRAALTILRLRRGSLWTGHADGTIREWHLATMTCIRSLAGHKAAVRDLQATAKRVVSVSEDAFARIWEFRVPPPSAPEHDLVRARLLDYSHLRKPPPKARRSLDSLGLPGGH